MYLNYEQVQIKLFKTTFSTTFVKAPIKQFRNEYSVSLKGIY